jgi:hypothetical protein
MNKQKWRLDELPSLTHPWRKPMMMAFTTAERYNRQVKDGLPFFTEEKLASLEERFKKTGMTRADIIAEVRKKGWLIKEATLKNYIQKDQVPKAFKKVKTSKGMISVYPEDMIRHLNFVRYCLFADRDSGLVDFMIDLIKTTLSRDDKTYLESKSLEVEGYEHYPSDMQGDDCLHALWIGISTDRFAEGLEWTRAAVEKAFREHPAKKDEYLKKLHEMEKLHSQLEDKMVEFQDELKANKTQINPDELKWQETENEDGRET